jgi:predicted dehydrogenase
MEAIVAGNHVEPAAFADPSDEVAASILETAPAFCRVAGLEDLLAAGLDGLVIATPTALHAEQAIAALERGVAVFCQKPLGRSAPETAAVIAAARRADRLLAVDLSYRFTAAVRHMQEVIASGELGDIFAADLTFHNAYGPDKAWFYDPVLSGGGCLIDLGVHLVDLALWLLGNPPVVEISGALFAEGTRVRGRNTPEDYAIATLRLETGVQIRIACSWRLPIGRDAEISGAFYGTRGAVEFRNVNGSFYDFVALRHAGTATQLLCQPPDAWGGRAAADWANRLADGATFDPEVECLVEVADVLDRIYLCGKASNAP